LLTLLVPTITAYARRHTLRLTPWAPQSIGARSTAGQNGNDVRALELGKAIERELGADEAHSYTLSLAADQYVLVLADQRGIDVSLLAFDPNGKKLVETDMFRVGETEELALVAETSGSYRLEVRSFDKTAAKGSYEVKIKELRAATEQDKSMVAAERLIAEGIELDRQATADTSRKAIEKYQQSIPLWQSAKDPAWESTALYLIGNAYVFLGEKQKAFDFSNQALACAEAAAKRPDEEQRRAGMNVKAYALETLGRVHNEFGDKKKALELFSQSLSLRKAIGNRNAEANILNNMATAYKLMGDYQNALSLWNQSRLIFSELGDRAKEGTALNNICVVQEDLGRYTTALDFCNQALAIRRNMNFRLGEATVLNNMAHIYSSQGEYQKALDLYTQSQAIYKTVGSRQGQGIAFNNIGFIYGTLGEYQKAIDFYNQALDIFRDEGDQYREANVLNNVANNYASMKDFGKALEINQRVLPLRKAVGDRAGEAVTLNNVANCYSNLGEKQKALDYYNQSIILHRSIGNPRQLASALRDAGALYRDLGEQQKALDYLTEGLQLTRTIGDRNGEAATLSYIARLERDRGNLVEAKQRIEEALAAVESLRISVKSQQLRASFFASVQKYYEFDIDVLMRLHKQRPAEGFDAAALAASEKGRARSLLELLAESRAEIRQGVDSSLLERERQLRQLIADTAERQIRLLSGQHPAETADIAAKQIDGLTTEYEQVLAHIRQTSPRYAALTQPLPLNLKEIQANVLDNETLLLEYSLGEERSFLWAVTQSSINTFELPKRQEVEATARHLFEVLTERNRVVKNEEPEQMRLRLTRSDAEYPSAAAALSNMLLRPIASQLRANRLVFVGEGVLQYVPFAALVAPTDETKNQTRQGSRQSPPPYRPLVLDHEIVNLPSASVMAVLRQETAGREPAPKTLAVLADPVFQSNDPRIAAVDSDRPATAKQEASSVDVYRSAKESGLEGFVRLRFTRHEADEITRLAPVEKRFEALDFVASRATAISAVLGQYRIVHFATHGLVNNQHPGLSGLVLSLVDERGKPQNGFLRLYEIYNLKLNADLVVLSACQTAVGEEIKGEGLLGLTRGFMYAGTPRVVATLWQVDDRAASELMKRFYQKMLGEGLRPAAALRAAQVSMQRDDRWRGPHYWAAFTLQGEWK
jgi:CHAT domain-containing protein/tetratricopeptide (TPR) repeat protein